MSACERGSEKNDFEASYFFIIEDRFVFPICKTFDRFVLGSAKKSFCGL